MFRLRSLSSISPRHAREKSQQAHFKTHEWNNWMNNEYIMTLIVQCFHFNSSCILETCGLWVSPYDYWQPEWSVMDGPSSTPEPASLPHYVTWHVTRDTFPAFIHWPRVPHYLSIVQCHNICHVTRPLQHTSHITIQSQLLYTILPKNKNYILFRQVPGKIHETWSLKVLSQQNSRIFWYEVSQSLALLHEILRKNINFGQF